MRLRLETAKKLRALGSSKAQKAKLAASTRNLDRANGPLAVDQAEQQPAAEPGAPKRNDRPTLAKPPLPAAKFRKRQVHKSWLPTHVFHAKRAHMTPPSAPLWRFALPLSPTQKGYRPTHRASNDRGAVVWDTSYISTIGLTGQDRSIDGLMRALGVTWGERDAKWKEGSRVFDTYVYEREAPHHLIAPVTICWSGRAASEDDKPAAGDGKMFVRVHPSAFFQLWEEMVRLAKTVKPHVAVEDLRFEIGSVQLTGPGSAEALVGVLRPTPDSMQSEPMKIANGNAFVGLAGLTSTNALPRGLAVSFDVQDPRLHHPPRTAKLPSTAREYEDLLHLTAEWPASAPQARAGIFDRSARGHGSKLASQKAIDRRKASSAAPGTGVEPLPTDPRIPTLLYIPSHRTDTPSGQWTLLAPWNAIAPIWHSLTHYPLSTGQQPRFGGLAELRQLAFEAGQPWFPGDFPGTPAGWAWEQRERRRRRDAWHRRPPAKRTSWARVDLGDARRGEPGLGWACDWALLLPDDTPPPPAAAPDPAPMPALLSHQPPRHHHPPRPALPPARTLLTVRLTLLARGVAHACARIYRLPSAARHPERRRAWLAQQAPSHSTRRAPAPPTLPPDAPPHELRRHLARALLHAAPAAREPPACPGEEDLLGFVTTGAFNLVAGRGTAVGSVVAARVAGEVGTEGALCVVRNAGESVGRLARWVVV